jgi:hypothetical protein
MSVSATCPECHATYRVKEHLQGKQFRCKVCQAAVPVGAEENPNVDLSQLLDDEDAPQTKSIPQETSTDLEVFEDTAEQMVLPRSQLQAPEVRRAPGSRNFAVQAAANPWVTLGILFFLGWVPFSLLELNFAVVMNIIAMSLCAAVCVTGFVLEMLEISLPDPLATVNYYSVGELMGLFVSRERFGPPPSKISGHALAAQFGWIIGFFAAHTVVLMLLKHFQVLPGMA